VLEDENYRVVLAASGDEAIAANAADSAFTSSRALEGAPIATVARCASRTELGRS